jgi:hypothetical protein
VRPLVGPSREVQYHRAVRVQAIVPTLALLLACSSSGELPRKGPAVPALEPSLACSGTSGAGFTRLEIGFSGGDATAAKPGFDVRYEYVAGALAPSDDCLSGARSNAVGCGTQWWGTWQWDQEPPGAYVRSFVADAAARGLLPMITYYVLLPASGVAEGTAEATQAARDPSFMARYLADFRFLLRQIGAAPAIVHVEPDFWGYAQRAAENGPPSSLAAAVASANPTDCGGLADTIEGLGRCLVQMTRSYAPNAKIALHGSPWATNRDCVANTDPALDVAAEARETADFLAACAPDADLVVVDMADRDAGYYASLGRHTWLDATDATLPSFAQAFRWSRALADRAAKPIFWWQLPVGNTGLANASGGWWDNRVEYFFAHPARVAASGAVGMAFGAGASGQTTPETDGGYLWACAASLGASGGQPLCAP